MVNQPPHREWRKRARRAAAGKRQGGNGRIVGGRGLGIDGRGGRNDGGGRTAARGAGNIAMVVLLMFLILCGEGATAEK